MNTRGGRKLSPMVLLIILLLLSRFIRGGISDPMEWIVNRLIMLPGIITGLSLHEFGHAIVSTKLGDPTPKSQGRVTINPLAHVDPIGLFTLLFAGFGWGVPVQINPSYYKHRRLDEALVAVAGVTMNLIIVIVTTIILKILVGASSGEFLSSTLGETVFEILQYVLLINTVLMFFNLLPVPPLDGFNLLTQIFNLSKYSWYRPLYQNGFLILLAMIMLNITGAILNPLVNGVYGICFRFIIG